jgi:hypothetical protein
MTTLTRTRMLAPGHVFTGTPEEIIGDIIGRFERPVAGFIASRLVHRDRQLVEDLTQDTFVQLWRYHVAKGREIDDRVYGLLCRIASQMICHHLRRLRSTELPVDLTDPANTATRAAVAPPTDAPHLAHLFAELESAKDALVTVAETYRTAHRAFVHAGTGLRNATRPDAVAHATEVARQRAEVEQAALGAFKDAADLVAARRYAWNEAATTLGNSGGDSDPDMDEALRRVRTGGRR